MEKIKKITLDDGILEIKQVCDEMLYLNKKSPFFFMVGAGISYPSAPLARDIITHCKEHALKYNRAHAMSESTVQDAYSDWFELAYPNRFQRQNYIKSILHNQPINLANIKLAHLLSQKVVTNMVITTNFDDFLSRSLNMFGIQHIVSDHPHTVEKIDSENNEIQIVHIHGTYWFYDCCNLSGEIIERAERQLNTNRTMSFFIDSLLYRRIPIVIGYSGWEKDVFMQALERRLESPLPFNLYWFCYSENDIESLPRWLRENSDVKFVVPSSNNEQRHEEDLDQILLGVKDVEKDNSVLEAKEVFEQFINKFNIESPEITRDPIGFYVKTINNSIASDNLSRDEEGQYFFKEVIDRLLRAKESKEYTTNLFLEELKELLKKSQYEEVINKVQKNYNYSIFNFQEHTELLDVILSASDKIYDNFRGYDLIVKISMQLLEKNIKSADIYEINKVICEALVGKADVLRDQGLFSEALRVYDEVISNFTGKRYVYYIVYSLFHKALTYEALQNLEEAIQNQDYIIHKYSNIKVQKVRNILASSYLKKAMYLFQNNNLSESIKVLDEFKLKYSNDNDSKMQYLLCLSLFFKSMFYNSNNLLDKELEVYDELLDLFGESEEYKIKETVARSLKNKGETLTKLQRHNDVLDTLDEITKRYTDEEESTLKEIAANAMMSKGRYLDNIGNRTEAIKMYERINKYYSQLEQISDTEQLQKAESYVAMGRFKEALTVYDDIISTIVKPDISNIDLLGKSYLGKIFALGQEKEYELSNQVIDTFIDKVKRTKELQVKRYVAFALFNKGLNLNNLEEHSKAMEVFKEVIRKFRNLSKNDVVLNELIQSSYYEKAITLGIVGETNRAVKELNSLYVNLKDETEHDLKILARKSLLGKAMGLCDIKKYQESLITLELVKTTYYITTDVDDMSFEYIYRMYKSECLKGLGNLKEALEVFLDIKQVLEKLSENHSEHFLGEINSIGFEAYIEKQYELSKEAFLLAFKCGGTISGSNLSFMLRRGEISDKDIPSQEELLAPSLKKDEPFAIINNLLLNIYIIKQEECIKLLNKINDFTRVLDWWSQLALKGDPEGHLVIGLLTRGNFVSDPNGMSYYERFKNVQLSGMEIPSWLKE
ncbi:SIR2 family protein [Paenibacillus sp. FSL R7-0272]|uniref:SIR2 family protein n=1 Tax=Paenibacillus sp. FSL R7-0272 TaxID=2921679 RepID=UPI0030DBBB9A